MSSTLRLPLFCADEEVEETAHALADELGLDLVDEMPSEGVLYLSVEREGIGLRRVGARAKAVRASFDTPQLDYRRRFGGGYRQPIARAVGVTGKHHPCVLDMTAGFGRDSFVLASLGCDVTMLERLPVVAAMVADGLGRAALLPRTAPIVARMHLILADSVEWIELHPSHASDVIYIDPMFPARRKSALVKGEMQVLHELVGTDEAVEPLLSAALKGGKSRVVIKRPRMAESSPVALVDFSVKGRRNRFDVYLPKPAPPA